MEYADDVLIAIAHHLPEGRKCFKYDSEKLNRFFYNQKQNHPEALSSFSFDLRGSWPTSVELSQALSNMSATGLIVVTSIKLDEYYFNCEKSYEEFVRERILDGELSDIEAIAADFDREIGIDEELTIAR